MRRPGPAIGYAGLGGAAGDRAMAKAHAPAGLKFFNGYLKLQFHTERSAIDDNLRAQIEAMRGHDMALWLAVSKVNREGRPPPARSPEGDDIVAAHAARHPHGDNDGDALAILRSGHAWRTVRAFSIS